MAILTFSNIGFFAAGMPTRLGEPLGVFGGEANLTGDASGSTLEHGFMIPAGDEQRMVLVVDWAQTETDTAAVSPGDLRVAILHHHELANVTLENTRATSFAVRQPGNIFTYELSPFPQWARAMPVWWRRDLGGTDGERMFVRFTLNNINLQVYRFRIGGRFFDARILASPDWHRLVFPS